MLSSSHDEGQDGYSPRCSWLPFWFALALTSLMVIGCGKPAGEAAALKGTVKFNGELVKKGSVRLSSEDDTPGPGGLSPITDGQYEIPLEKGTKAGKYLVMVYGFKETGRMIKVDDGAPPIKEEVQFIPRKYNDDSKEHLELQPGDNARDFDLSK
ncbi:MAG: hypothetical protein V4719_13885 [Planctomycetota bacterium]